MRYGSDELPDAPPMQFPDSPVATSISNLRHEVARRREEDERRKRESGWNPDSVVKVELRNLIVYIEEQLNRIPPSPSVSSLRREIVHRKKEFNLNPNKRGYWSPDHVCKVDLVNLIDYIQEQLGCISDSPTTPEAVKPNGAAEAPPTKVQSVWPQSQQIITRVEQFIRLYCVLPELAYLAVAVLCVATHLTDCFDAVPYLALHSPLPQCGKTRLLEIIELLAFHPWRGIAPSVAALFRMMQGAPTLLLDEVEVLKADKNASETQKYLLAILNEGYRKGATVPRCDGRDHRLQHFPVFGFKAFATITTLPSTLADRSIVISMQRKRTDQKIARFRFATAKAEAEPLKKDIERWANKHKQKVKAEYHAMPDPTFLSDRDAEIWSSLFAVCTVCEPQRLEELKESATVLSGRKRSDKEEDSAAIRLLADCRALWPNGKSQIPSEELVIKLRGLEESPWLEYDLTQRKLARKLHPFEITSRNINNGATRPKGYIHEEMERAWSRYLSHPSPS